VHKTPIMDAWVGEMVLLTSAFCSSHVDDELAVLSWIYAPGRATGVPISWFRLRIP
jgi:hypothetical protein